MTDDTKPKREPAHCPRCCGPARTTCDRVQVGGCPSNVSVSCADNCDESVPIGYGATEAAAVADWNVIVDEQADDEGPR